MEKLSEVSSDRKIILSGRDNYEVWKFQYNIAVKGQKEPVRMKYIVFTVSENVLRRLTTCKSSEEMLDKLDELYGVDLSVNKLYLQNKFYSLKCSENVIDFVDEVDSLMSKLAEVKEVISDEMVVSKVLCSLPKSYQAFVTAFECSHDTSFKNLRSKLNLEFERRLLSSKTRQNDYECDSTEQNAKSFFSNKSGVVICYYCKKGRHYIKDCPILKEKNKTTKCYRCNQIGHISKYCSNETSSVDEKVRVAATVLAAGTFDSCVGNCFILDSGASQHMSFNQSLFDFIKKGDLYKGIVMPDGEVLQCCGIGQITLNINNVEIQLTNVLYVPNLKFNLIAIRNFIKNNIEVCLKLDCWEMKRNGLVILTGKVKFDLYLLEFCEFQDISVDDFESINSAEVEKVNITLQEWHTRLGHQNLMYVKDLLKKQNISYKNEKVDCESCKLGKMSRKPFSSSESIEKNVGDLVHMDVGGPMETPSLGNKRFYLLLRDDFSNWRTIYFLTNKSEVKDHIASYLTWFKTQTGLQVKKMRSDNGLEMINNDIELLLQNQGISHEKTCPYSPEQNGRLERDNRTVVECARTLLIEANLNKKFWAEATNAAVFILNRSGRTKVPGATPIELFLNKRFDVSFFKPFGSAVYVHVPKEKRKKWDPKARKGIFVGYDDGTKGYRIYFENTHGIELHRDVDFINVQQPQVAIVQNAILLNEEPKAYEEIEKRTDAQLWKLAISKELEAMKLNDVWDEVQFDGQNLIDTKWVFKIKADGQYKARLVARGCFQNLSDDFDVFAPVAKMETVRVLFSVAVKFNFLIHQMDVDTAFLNGVLEEEVFISPPQGVEVKLGNVLKIKKSMYGLRQSPKCWYKYLNKVLCSIGFKNSKFDECVYSYNNVYCLVFVDDILLMSSDLYEIENVKKQLACKFNVKDLGQISQFLGMNVNVSDDHLTIDQEEHIEKFVKKFGLEFCKSKNIPIEPYCGEVDEEQKDSSICNKSYRQLLGTLLYVMSTSRPDISYAVNFLSRYQTCPDHSKYKSLLGVLKYLNTSKNLKLNYDRDCDEPLSCYVDSSWADKEDRKSTTGFVIFVYGNPVMWKSRKQTSIALSSAEAEYIALCESIKEIVWVKGLLSEFAINSDLCKVYEDNSSCISMAKTNLVSKRSKHVDVKYHYVKEMVDKNVIQLCKIDTQEQIADGLTKPLGNNKFREFLSNLKLKSQ